MTYELTQDLMTGNALIDSEHRQLFAAVNNLMTACSQGKGRDQIQQTVTFLSNYVVKHFQDEERLQTRATTPTIPPTSSSTTDTAASSPRYPRSCCRRAPR